MQLNLPDNFIDLMVTALKCAAVDGHMGQIEMVFEGPAVKSKHVRIAFLPDSHINIAPSKPKLSLLKRKNP